MNRRLYRPASVGGLVLTVAFLALILWGRGHPIAESRTTGSGGVLASDSPIGDGERTDFATADSQTKHVMLLPDSPLANSSDLEQVWTQPAFDEVALVYSTNGKSLVVDQYQSQRGDPADPTNSFKEEMQATSAEARIGDVSGNPALITEGGTDANKTNPSDVIFIVNGIEVNLFSDNYSTDELLKVAGTVAPENERSPTPDPSAAGSSPPDSA
jgi:hypothetical protein